MEQTRENAIEYWSRVTQRIQQENKDKLTKERSENNGKE